MTFFIVWFRMLFPL